MSVCEGEREGGGGGERERERERERIIIATFIQSTRNVSKSRLKSPTSNRKSLTDMPKKVLTNTVV